MNLVDSHAHLSGGEFDSDREEVVARAFAEGIARILCPAELSDPKNLQVTLELASSHPGILAAGGVHPHNAGKFGSDHIRMISQLAEDKKICAVGEIGLDFHYNFSPPKQQIEALRAQLNTAQRLGLPVILHSREAAADVYQAVLEENFTCGGILHCFTEDWNFASRMMDRDFHISFSGIITFPGSHDLREVARRVPMDRILIETDSPYLVPAPFRGRIKRNEPMYVKPIGHALASLKNLHFSTLTDRIKQNFESLFCV